MTTTLEEMSTGPASGPKPITLGRRKGLTQFAVYVFILVPFVALVAAIPFVWGWGLSWLDVGLGVFFFYFTGLGVTIGYHRHFTHGSFKAKRPLRIFLAIAASMAV